MPEGKPEGHQHLSGADRARESAGPAPKARVDALLERFRPVIQYDSQESYAADSAASMTDCVPAGSERGNLLRGSDDRVIASVAPGPDQRALSLDFLRAGSYPDGTAVSSGDYLDAVGKHYVVDARAMHARPGYGDQIYGHSVIDADGATWLQYWFFYYYNNKAFLFSGLHEGDWEMIQLRLGADGEPDLAAYAQHTRGERCAWGEVEQDTGPEGPVPVVYSARGSHASYFRPGTYPEAPVIPDHNDAQGPRVRPRLEIINDDDPAWAAWPGRWGSTRAELGPIGANSPPGPHEHGAWRDPLSFYNASAPAPELGPVAGAAVRAPPAPEIEPRREGNRAVISYRFPAAPGLPRPAQLVVSLDGRGDDRPPATTSQPIEALSGDVEFPLPLEDRDYTVRVSSASEDGLTSDTSSAPLRLHAGRG